MKIEVAGSRKDKLWKQTAVLIEIEAALLVENIWFALNLSN